MMEMKKIICLSIPLALFCTISTVGCKNQAQPAAPQMEKEVQAPVEQKLTLSFSSLPEKPMPHKPVTLNARVMEGTKEVTDAKVELEVWQKGDKKHDMFTTRYTEKGTYTATINNAKKGDYFVVVHVTTPKTHQMINGQFHVGPSSTSNGHHTTQPEKNHQNHKSHQEKGVPNQHTSHHHSHTNH